jgi:predicted fused transcriptional regulator/phosphomethylpyrimidine kinase/predicted transcriptional regulator
MTLQPPEELMTQLFLPAMRQLVSIRLRSEGLSQSKISSVLGITQASVSMYLSAGPRKAISILSKFSLTSEEADSYSAVLAEDVKRDPVAGIRTLSSLWTGILGSGAACGSHREMYPFLGDCDFCMKEYGRREGTRPQVLADVADAVKMLEASRTFVSVMPEVSVNIACSDGSSNPAGIVAVPGRIVKVRGRPKAMLPPEPGASVHLSRILSLVRRERPDLRACINIRYDRGLDRILGSLRFRTLTIVSERSHRAGDPTAEALERALTRPHGEFGAIVDRGGSGIEPNVYLFAKGAKEVAGVAIRVSKKYSAGQRS